MHMYVYTYTHIQTQLFFFLLGYMLLVDVMEVLASNQWNTLTHTLTSGVCVLQCPKDVEVWELQHTMDSYMLLVVMMPLLLTIAPGFLTVWNGKMFLFIYVCIHLVLFPEIRKIFRLPESSISNPFRRSVLCKIIHLLLGSKYFQAILLMHFRSI